MTQANDLPSRMSRAEDNIIDLRLAASAILQAIDKNSADIAGLIEVTRRNSEAIARNSEAIARLSNEMVGIRAATAELQASRQDTQAAIRDIRSTLASINATIERMDRLFDYLIRRDQGQQE